ncbi:cytochrome P450 [Arenibacter sp. GZD96]|uniref:cytochrome P450 n=1 Tax=Aurantibrevibacter litoralis TaxID=3106030 RepID=UPI002AFF4DC1|nr:cytochrome P450 [Arenibacter sp. GZD-96]MEA1784594.1 cytochrome P450 [Arenibacter sp. GZD-96]
MKNLPRISTFQVFKNAQRILKNPLPFHHQNFTKFGDHFRVKLGTKESVLFTRNPELIKHVLQKQHKIYWKSPLQTVDLAKYIGHGILTSNGEHWRTHRRMVQPAFHKKKLSNLLGIMLETIRLELKRIEPDTVQDAFSLMGDLAFQVVATSLFSTSDSRSRMARLKKITEDNQQMLIKEMRQPYLKWWYRLKGDISTHLGYAEEARNILLERIEARRLSVQEKDDVLDMLLRATYEDGSSMSNSQLIDEVLILFTAGHETTANALSFTLFLLATHPEIQKKAFKEVTQVEFETSNLMEVLGRLPYCRQCLEEAMRLYPPVYVIDRIATEDDQYKDIHIPKGTLVLLSIYELHRYENFWDRPSVFNPDRFAMADKKEIGDYYYPFGAGPRMCVGNNFAMYEMIFTIAEIIKKFELSSPIQSMEINPLISLKPKNVPIQFKERHIG